MADLSAELVRGHYCHNGGWHKRDEPCDCPCQHCRWAQVAKEISPPLSRTGVLRTLRGMGHRIIIRGGTVYPAIKRLTRSTNYVAVCSCRWMGKAQETRDAAEQDGAAHIDGPGCADA